MPAPDGPQFTDPAERAFARRNQATYDAAEAMDERTQEELELEGGAYLSDLAGGGRWIEDPEPVSHDEEGNEIDIEEIGSDQVDMAGRRFSPNYDEGADLDAYLSGVEQRQEERKAERGE
jgi:hypothetical protein